MTGAIAGHHRSRATPSDDWLTPPWVIEALGPFDLDPCHQEERPWPTAANHYTKRDDGLMQRWFGRVYLNAPFNQMARWIARLADHGRGTALVFARTETAYWFSFVWPRATALLFVQGRIVFHLPDGRPAPKRHGKGGNGGGPAVLVAYGPEDADRLADSGIAGAFVPLAGGGQMVVAVRPDVRAAEDGIAMTWTDLLRNVAAREGGRLELRIAYVLVQHHPKVAANRHWQAKVRQVLQGGPFRRLGRGRFELAV